MFPIKGEMTPPCGAPLVVGVSLPSSITPELRNFSMISKIFPSAISALSIVMIILWGMLSKNPLMSTSTTNLYPSSCIQYTFDGLMTISASSKAKWVFMKLFFKYRVDELTNYFLCNSCVNCRNAKRPSLSAFPFSIYTRFRGGHCICISSFEISHQYLQEFFNVFSWFICRPILSTPAAPRFRFTAFHAFSWAPAWSVP